ncbi:MAG: DoxX family protein [Actinomycetota bacterium]
MRNMGLLVARLVVGGYLAAHGAQKLFGAFGGRGLEAAAAGFERQGLRPAKAAAVLAAASEFGGGLLTATGIADPLGPLAIAGTMTVAAATHRQKGPFNSKGGYELALTNLAAALALASTGPGKLRIGPPLPKSLRRLAVAGGAVLAGVSLFQVLGPKPPAS